MFKMIEEVPLANYAEPLELVRLKRERKVALNGRICNIRFGRSG